MYASDENIARTQCEIAKPAAAVEGVDERRNRPLIDAPRLSGQLERRGPHDVHRLAVDEVLELIESPHSRPIEFTLKNLLDRLQFRVGGDLDVLYRAVNPLNADGVNRGGSQNMLLRSVAVRRLGGRRRARMPASAHLPARDDDDHKML